MEKGIPICDLVSSWSTTETTKLRKYIEQAKASAMVTSYFFDISEI